MEENVKVVALIGSSKNKETILKMGKEYNLRGIVAIHSDIFTGADGYEINEKQIDVCVENGHRRIDMADEVVVVNPDGYFGDSTAEEIAYALMTDKPVRYLVEPENPVAIVRLFVSYPMYGLTDQQIEDDFVKYTEFASNILKEHKDELEKLYGTNRLVVAYIDSICREDRTPMGYLQYSIEMLEKADVAFFAEGFRNANGCRAECCVANEYYTPIIIYPTDEDGYKFIINKNKERR